MSNRLIDETSPYLLQHAHNPVDWFPWGREAFERAEAEDKVVLVSIGYAACHWCHVMERESFENEATARVMNDLLVCIKVDREERPDVDGIYMSAVQQLHGHGGWPLNVFLLPDGRPFYGGTYFPPADRGGMPSWTKVVAAVSEAYHNQRDAVLQNANVLTGALRNASGAAMAEGEVTDAMLAQAGAGIVSLHDAEHGGFGGAPKFPQSMPMEFLLARNVRAFDADAQEAVETSLTAMHNGGIYDHLGGGFARYSTDRFWLVPHFEKMLYDNALLLSVYTQAFQTTGDPRYREVVEETAAYLLRDLSHPDGGFFSSQDADSEGVEGRFYVWTPQEIEAALGAEDARLFRRYYGVGVHPNFEGRHILHVRDSAAAAGRELGVDASELLGRLPPMRRALLERRAERVPPATDDKVLTAWNALALRALAEAAFALDQPGLRDAAERNAGFLLREMHRNGRLLRTWKNGKARLLAYLEDYALLINGLLSLHTATFSHRWLHEAQVLTDEMLALFRDDAEGAFYDVGRDHEELIVRPRDPTDNATPSGSSAAAEALLRMAALSGSEPLAEHAQRLIRGIGPLAMRYPLGFGNWLRIIERSLAPSTEVVVTGDPSDERTRALLAPLRRQLPSFTFVGLASGEPAPFPTPLLEGRAVTDAPTAYVCHGYVCDLPARDAETLTAQLGQPSPPAPLPPSGREEHVGGHTGFPLSRE